MFYENLKRIRKEKRITQNQLADFLNVSRGSVGNWETGMREPDLETLSRIADYFHVSTDFLLGREDPTSSNFFSNQDYSILSAFHASSSETQNIIRMILHLPECPLDKIVDDPALSIIDEFKQLEKKKPSSV